MLLRNINEWWTNFPNQVRIWGSLFVSRYTNFSLSDNVEKCGVFHDILEYKCLRSAWLMLHFVTKCFSSSTTLHVEHRRSMHMRYKWPFCQLHHLALFCCDIHLKMSYIDGIYTALFCLKMSKFPLMCLHLGCRNIQCAPDISRSRFYK